MSNMPVRETLPNQKQNSYIKNAHSAGKFIALMPVLLIGALLFGILLSGILQLMMGIREFDGENETKAIGHQNAERHFENAAMCTQRGDYDNAIKFFCLAIDPKLNQSSTEQSL